MATLTAEASVRAQVSELVLRALQDEDDRLGRKLAFRWIGRVGGTVGFTLTNGDEYRVVCSERVRPSHKRRKSTYCIVHGYAGCSCAKTALEPRAEAPSHKDAT